MAFVTKSPKHTIFDVVSQQRERTQSQIRKMEAVQLKQFRKQDEYVVSMALCKQHPFRKFQQPKKNLLQSNQKQYIHQQFQIKQKKARYLQKLQKQTKMRVTKKQEKAINLGPGQYDLPSTLNKKVKVLYQKTISKRHQKNQSYGPGPGQYHPKFVEKNNPTIIYQNSTTKRLQEPQQVKLVYEEDQHQKRKNQKFHHSQEGIKYSQQISSSFRKSVKINKCFQLKKLLFKSRQTKERESKVDEEYIPEQNKHPSPCSYDQDYFIRNNYSKKIDHKIKQQNFRYSYLNKNYGTPSPQSYEITSKNSQRALSQPFLSGVPRKLTPQKKQKAFNYWDYQNIKQKHKVTNLGFGGKQTRFREENIKVDIGPGEYNINESSKSLGCLLFSCSNSKRQIFQQLLGITMDNPGTGAYNLTGQFLKKNSEAKIENKTENVSRKISKNDSLKPLFYIGKQNYSFFLGNKQVNLNQQKTKKRVYYKQKTKKQKGKENFIKQKSPCINQIFYSRSPSWNIHSFNVSFQNDK